MPADLRGLDLVFCALPHGASQALMPQIVDDVTHVVDLGADFRLPPDVYARWYGEAHTAPELVERFAYGLVELYRDDLATHAHVASPGCYPTAVSLACAPLLALDLAEPRVIADAVSGVSGAGRGLKTTSLFSEANENVSAYGLLTHRHTAEMELALGEGRAATGRRAVHAAPRADDARHPRDVLRAAGDARACRPHGLLEHYREFYADDPCVVVVDEPSGTKATYGANVVHVTARFDERTDTVIAIAARTTS